MSENIKEKIEDKIIDLITLGASGRLVVFKPEGPEGYPDKDLIVEKKGDYKNKVVSLKIFDKELFGNEEIKNEINPDINFYLIFAKFNFIKQDIEDEIFVVSTVDFKKTPMDKKDFFRYLIEKLEEK